MRWSWHDSQRVGQILIILFYTCLFFYFKFSIFSRKNSIVFFSFFSLAIISCLLSKNKVWALTEMAIFLGSYVTGFVLFYLLTMDAEGRIENYLFFTLFLTAASLSIYFFMAYISSFLLLNEFNVWDFVNGFSNIRFFGQFLTLLLPVLVAPVLLKKKWSNTFFFISCLIAFMLIASGTRAALLGIGSVVFAYLFIGSESKKWAFLMIKISCIGFLMHYILIDVLPDYFQIAITNNAMDRKIIGLSAREIIWKEAIVMTIEKPFFGYGPMHFANIKSEVANHPHQLFLQILSEWGILFFMLFLFLFKKIIVSLLKELKNFSRIENDDNKLLYICLTAAIFSSLIQSMVDGVFVMPYTEIVFVLMSAWLASVFFNKEFKFEKNNSKTQKIISNLLVILFSIIMTFAFVKFSPTYIGKSQNNYYNNMGDYMPRFWLNGGF